MPAALDAKEKAAIVDRLFVVGRDLGADTSGGHGWPDRRSELAVGGRGPSGSAAARVRTGRGRGPGVRVGRCSTAAGRRRLVALWSAPARRAGPDRRR